MVLDEISVGWFINGKGMLRADIGKGMKNARYVEGHFVDLRVVEF